MKLIILLLAACALLLAGKPAEVSAGSLKVKQVALSVPEPAVIKEALRPKAKPEDDPNRPRPLSKEQICRRSWYYLFHPDSFLKLSKQSGTEGDVQRYLFGLMAAAGCEW